MPGLVIKNYCIRLSYHLKNYGDRGGCYPSRPYLSLFILRSLFQERVGDTLARDPWSISCIDALMFFWIAALGCVYQEGTCLVLLW